MTPTENPDCNQSAPASFATPPLLGAWWEIPHPGTPEMVKCATFTEAMDKWFEGFNIPVLVVDGVREDFKKSFDRVSKHYAAPDEKPTDDAVSDSRKQK